MITIHEARALIDQTVRPLPPVPHQPADAVGCRLDETLRAPFDVPRFACSSMDGIAVRSGDLKGTGPWRLRVEDVVGAGVFPTGPLSPGCAVKIMTGAPLIDGADTVVRLEDLRFEDGHVIVTHKPPIGNYVRPPGDDIKTGVTLYEEGTELSSVDAGVLTSIGLQKVSVTPRPKVNIFSTGSELIRPGLELRPGQLYNSNIVLLQSLLDRRGITPTVLHDPIPDDADLISATLERHVDTCDLIVTTGGVSVGDFDFLPDSVQRLGAEVLFHGVRVKPGKPALFARFENTWFVGLPGNPVSVVATFHLYVERIISKLMGFESRTRSAVGRLQSDLSVTGHRFCLVAARIIEQDGMLRVYPSTRQRSGRLSSIIGLNGFVMLDEDTRSLRAGDDVVVEWLG